MQMPCLFCGGDASHPDHLLRCTGSGVTVPPVTSFADYRAPYARDSETSQAAAVSVEPSAESLCGQIYEAIKRRGTDGMTCSEVEDVFTLRHQTASARLWDLRTREFIEDSGQRRPSTSGRSSIVWVRTIAENRSASHGQAG